MHRPVWKGLIQFACDVGFISKAPVGHLLKSGVFPPPVQQLPLGPWWSLCGQPCPEASVVVTLRVRGCEFTALTAVLVDPQQQNQSDFVCGEERNEHSPCVFES